MVLSLGTDLALRAAGVFPPLGQEMSDALFVLATVYRTLYGVVGSYVTARLAPDRPMGHALVGGLIGGCPEYSGRRRYLEQGSRAALVSPRTHCHRDAYRMAGRQSPRHAVAIQPSLVEYHCLVSVG